MSKSLSGLTADSNSVTGVAVCVGVSVSKSLSGLTADSNSGCSPTIPGTQHCLNPSQG